jgi:hypothetical protein
MCLIILAFVVGLAQREFMDLLADLGPRYFMEAALRSYSVLQVSACDEKRE